MKRISLAAARRIALGAQGFNDPAPKGQVTARHLRRVLDRMTILQLDSVNVFCRSHYLPFLARLGPYDRDRLDRLLYRSGHYFEYLSHEASIVAQDYEPYLRWRMESGRWKSGLRLEQDNPGYVEAVLNEVADKGPLSIKDLSDPGQRSGPWWGLSKGKLALEWLYQTGRLSVHHRTRAFVTVYDTPQRVIRPEIQAVATPNREVAYRELLSAGARSHGIGTATDIVDYFRLSMREARPILTEMVADGELAEVQVDGWNEPAFVHCDAKRPRQITGRALLSPFDPVVWFRPRALRLFGFHYRIEIYVPEPDRVYGYYVLPLLVDDQLVGRVDLKSDRASRVLLARGVYAEPGVDHDRVGSQMADALNEAAAWLGLDQGVEVSDRGNLAPKVRAMI